MALSEADIWQQYDQLGYYELLGLDAGATVERIQAAYRDRIQTFHPDVCPEDRSEEAASAITSRLNAARKVLTDPTERRQYDRLGHATYCHQIGNSEHVRDGQESAPGAGRGARPEGKAHAATDPDAGAGAGAQSGAQSPPGAGADSEPTADASNGTDDTDTADASAGADAGAGRTATSGGGAAGDGSSTAGRHDGGTSAQSTDTTQTHFGRDAGGDGEWGAANRDRSDTADGRRRTDEWGAAASGAGAETGAGASTGSPPGETAGSTGGSGATTSSTTSSQAGSQWADLGGWLDKIAYLIGLILGIPYWFFLGASARFSLMGLLAAPVIGFLELWVISGWWMTLTKWTLLPLLQGVGLLKLVGFAIAQVFILGVPQALIMVGIDGGMGPPEATLTSRLTGLAALLVWIANLPTLTEPIWGAIPVVGSWLRSASFMQPFLTPQGGPFPAGTALQTGAVGAGFIVIHVAVYAMMTGTMLAAPWVQPAAESGAVA